MSYGKVMMCSSNCVSIDLSLGPFSLACRLEMERHAQCTVRGSVKKIGKERDGDGGEGDEVKSLFLSLSERGMCWKGDKSTKSDCTTRSV